MSYPLGTKVRLVQSWRAYGAGFVLEQGYEVDLETLVRMGLAVRVDEAESPGRPAKLARAAAKKLGELFKPT